MTCWMTSRTIPEMEDPVSDNRDDWVLATSQSLGVSLPGSCSASSGLLSETMLYTCSWDGKCKKQLSHAAKGIGNSKRGMYCENEADEARESECGSGRSQVGVGQWRYGPSAPSEDQDPIPANNSCSMDQNRNNLLFASSSTHSIPSCRPWPDTALLLIIIHLCVKMSSSRRPFEAISKTPVCTIKTIFLPFEPHLRSWILGHHVYY